MHSDNSISVWFFIGVLLVIYGVLILGYGVTHLGAPTPGIVLGEVHIDAWWGALLLAVGAGYSWAFAPNRTKNK